jgi:hypothetical protein
VESINDDPDYELPEERLRALRAICPLIEQILANEDLAPHGMKLVRDHIPGCAACRRQYAQFYLDDMGGDA